MRRLRVSASVLCVTAALLQSVPSTPSAHAAAVPTLGAAIFVAGNVSGKVRVFNQAGTQLDRFEAGFDSFDQFATGDVDANGIDEVLVANEVSGDVAMFDQGGAPRGSFFAGFDTGDGFATGDVDGDGDDEVLVAGDVDNQVHMFDSIGTEIYSDFDSGFDPLDGFASGDVDGDGDDEVLVAGNAGGRVHMFDLNGTEIFSDFFAGFDLDDGFASGDVDGDGDDEVLVAGNAGGRVHMFDLNGTEIFSDFFAGFDLDDGFASGDVDGDGDDEVLVAGNAGHDVHVFDRNATELYQFDSTFDLDDRLAVAGNGYPDADGDGLLDFWETSGLDADGDGTMDIDLPTFGADPMHKDIFVELDWMLGAAPRSGEIRTLKAAFSAAPVDAGGVPNPDGLPGINLWIDTSGFVDPAGVEDGIGGCSNNNDDGGDGLTDGEDPDCIAGDDFGGGNQIATFTGCLGSDFYSAKDANFADARASVFRYAIQGLTGGCGGGQAEIGGNDVIDINQNDGSGGTFMHELGHTLNLHHGGDVNENCKPNYVSVMNYNFQFGIPQNGGGSIIDYSPPRYGNARSAAGLPNLDEDHLTEAGVLDVNDPNNWTAFTDDTGSDTQRPLNLPINWDGDATPGETDVQVNINDDGNDGTPAACSNPGTNSLTGYDDWSNIVLNFRQWGDSADAAINPTEDPELTDEEGQQILQSINTTDLALEIDDSPDPVAAGTQLSYSLTVTNGGPNPAWQPRLVVTLPAEVSYVSDTAGCLEAPADTLTCDIAGILAGDSAQVGVTVDVPADLVFENGGPLTITVLAEVANMAGPDPETSNNSSGEDTDVVAVSDLAIESLTAPGGPAEILIGQPVELNLAAELTNSGPSAPMDAAVDGAASAASGASVTPSAQTTEVPALDLNEARTVEQAFTLECSEPGLHAFTFDYHVRPLHTADSDPNPPNDESELELTLDCVVPVAINIKPGSFPNAISLRGSSVAVAILTTDAGEYGLPLPFDASMIDPLSVRFGPEDVLLGGGGATEYHGAGHLVRSLELDEMTRDADLDMVLHFRPAQTGLVRGDSQACVRGEFVDAFGSRFTFVGCDSVVVVK